VQETFLAALQHISSFEARSSIRTWLYQIATNRCLDALRTARRRQTVVVTASGAPYPEPNGTSEVMWLEPYPDLMLEGLAETTPGPDARFETRETISVAFVAALQRAWDQPGGPWSRGPPRHLAQQCRRRDPYRRVLVRHGRGSRRGSRGCKGLPVSRTGWGNRGGSGCGDAAHETSVSCSRRSLITQDPRVLSHVRSLRRCQSDRSLR
jgi:Sigma-70 region 2